MTGVVVVRAFEPRDRGAVRDICCDTADRGRPVEGYFPDREIAADLITLYYTEYEPDALWVADAEGRVVGYLTGCVDTRRYQQVMAWQVLPRTVARAVARGVLGRRETWRLAWAAAATWIRSIGRRQPPLTHYPAHFHINLQQEFRGQQLGPRLIERFVSTVHAAGIPGVHAAVRGDNASACHFFERMGFLPVRRHQVIFPEGAGYGAHDTIVYGKTLQA